MGTIREEILSLLVFSLQRDESLDRVLVSQDYAVAVFGDKSLEIIHTRDFIGTDVPANYVIPLHGQSDLTVRNSIMSMNSDGHPEVYKLKESGGGQVMERLVIDVDLDSYNSQIVSQDIISALALDLTVELSSLQIDDKLIAIGCSMCLDQNGWIQFFDRQTLSKLGSIEGSTTNTKVGASIALMQN